jgi:hypothetical protein
MADQLNFNTFTYVDDNAASWNVRGEDSSILNAVNGSTAFGGHPHWPRESRRFHVRKARYVDSTTFRSKTIIVYTPTAFAALTVGTSTLALHVPGNTATVTYTLAAKIPERQPGAAASRQLTDHT